MDINDLRRMLKAAAETMGTTAQALDDLEASGTAEVSAIEAATAAFDAAKADFEGLKVRVARAEEVEAAKIAEKAKHTLLSKRNFSSVSDIDNHEKTEKYIRLKIDSWLEKEKLIFGNNGKIDDVL